MSEYVFFHGYFEESDLPIEPDDTDDFSDLEKEHHAHFVQVDGKLYKFWSSGIDVDAYDFTVVVGPTDMNQLLLYWHNGGAGLHEVAEEAISDWLKKDKPNE